MHFNTLGNELLEARMLNANFVGADGHLRKREGAQIRGRRGVGRVRSRVRGGHSRAGNCGTRRICDRAGDTARILLRVRNKGNREQKSEEAEDRAQHAGFAGRFLEIRKSNFHSLTPSRKNFAGDSASRKLLEAPVGKRYMLCVHPKTHFLE